MAQRYKTPVGEIDLVALKGKRLAFIEVKRRKTREDAAWTIPTRQRRRIVRAAQYWLAGHPSYAGHDIAFDVVLAAPWAWPRYHRQRISGLTMTPVWREFRGAPPGPHGSRRRLRLLLTIRRMSSP